MDESDRDSDKKHLLYPPVGSGRPHLPVSLDQIKSVYITEGISVKDISDRFKIPLDIVTRIVRENKLEEVRSEHVRQGLKDIQNVQLNQAKKLMDLENNFKSMRIVQLEKILEDYLAYYHRHGHFNKLHPITGEVMKDMNGLPIQLNVPNITKEITALKESVSLSTGLKAVLAQIDQIINKPRDLEYIDASVIDVTEYDNLFKQNKDDE